MTPLTTHLPLRGTYEEVTKLQLSSSGAMRLKVPKVTSEEQLKVKRSRGCRKIVG
jgi:hypothetical protein